ncbi:TLC domain-containing protein [Linnemannia elongata]|nr:TLC domain-containing protein [Linnemannia elongata]
MALQYQTVLFDEVTGQKQVVYGKGWNDLYMVMVWVMIWTAIREVVMTILLIPLGRRLGVGGKKKKQQQGQQSSSVSSLANPSCLLYDSSYWSDSTFFWRDYPKTHLDPTMKWYYLVQFAFWVQQFLLAVLGIEKRRKDFLEFMIHHVITCLLIGFSYSFNLTSVGHAVLCSMDFSDIVLAACKMLKYCQKDQLADVGFVFFVVTWIYTRHVWFGQIILATFKAPQFASMVWDPSNGLYFTPAVLKGFQVLLCGLYAVLVFWLAMIFKIVLKVLKGENSEDVRSEDEEEAEEEVVDETKKAVEVEDVPRRSMQVLHDQTVLQ